MNYTRDDALAAQITKAGLSFRAKANPVRKQDFSVGPRVFIGLGVFLMKNEPEMFLKQYKLIAALNQDGIVFFSYDDLSEQIIIEKMNKVIPDFSCHQEFSQKPKP